MTAEDEHGVRMSFLRWIIERTLRGQVPMRVDDLPEVRDVGRPESPDEVGEAIVTVDQELKEAVTLLLIQEGKAPIEE